MTKIDDGGPAFPMSSVDSQTGMSLREWFAGQALAGICANPNNHNIQEVCARISYAQADAMIAEGKKKDGTE